MALLFIDGFEGYASRADILTVQGSVRWIAFNRLFASSDFAFSPTVFLTTQPAAANSRSLFLDYCITTRGIEGVLALPSLSEVVMGFGLYLPDGPAEQPILRLGQYSGNSEGFCLGLTPAGELTVSTPDSNGQPGTTKFAQSSGLGLGADVWYYVEVRVKRGTTNGECEVRVDGQNVISAVNINTAAGSVTAYTLARFWSTYYGFNRFYIDDLYVCDTTGTRNNSFLGQISVFSLLPTANGSTNQMTPVGAADQVNAVNEATGNTTSYVQSSTSGHTEYYAFQALPAYTYSSIAAVAVAVKGSTDSAFRNLRAKIFNSGGTSLSSNLLFSIGNWFRRDAVFETSPDGTDWTKASVDSTQAGYEVV